MKDDNLRAENDIARKAFRELDASYLLHHNLDDGKAVDVIQIIQSAIEEATRKLSRKCFDLTEEIAELRSQEPADRKRLLGLLRQVYDEHMHFGWGYEELHDAIYKELEAAKMLPIKAIDAAMKEGK